MFAALRGWVRTRAGTLPSADPAAMRAEAVRLREESPSVLVSLIVRSMGRPELRSTLESIARQDHAPIEVVIVDATGGHHPPLPQIDWPPGHVVRVVSSGVPLKRPQAAMFGLQSVEGVWLMFLDDDDTCEPSHVSSLVRAASRHPGALLIYGCGRLHDERGRLQQVFGRPFNRALMHYGPLFYWQSAIISTRVRELGCGFDPSLDVCEDRDFLAQIAEHGDFVFEPAIATFNYRPDLGTSGTGQGANRNAVRVARFENLLRAKWAGPGVYHNERVATLCRNGVRAFFEGDLDRSQSAFELALSHYPDDPNALHGRGRVSHARGDVKAAERDVRRAIEINPLAAEYHATLSDILGGSAKAPDDGPAPQPSRTSPCLCGSGLRYKACCGRLASSSSPRASGTDVHTHAADPLLAQVEALVLRRQASRALRLLQTPLDDPRCTRAHLVAAARLHLALDNADAALELLTRAVERGIDNEVGLMLDACCARLSRSHAHASLWRQAGRLRVSPARSSTSTGQDDSIAIALATNASPDMRRQAIALRSSLLDGSQTRAVELTIIESPRPCSTLIVWEPADDVWPQGDASPRRVIVYLQRDDPEMLLRSLARLELRWPDAVLDFTRSQQGLDDDAMTRVQYPWIDASLFERAPPRNASTLRLGLHGAASSDQLHPDDGSFHRSLLARGHRIVLPSLPAFHAAFSGDAVATGVDWFDHEVPIAALDVVIARGDPQRHGWADARVLEAMAAARPLIAFAHALGAHEWIEQGVTGFVVQNEDEARARLAQLESSGELRNAMGAAARRRAHTIVREQAERAKVFYFTNAQGRATSTSA